MNELYKDLRFFTKKGYEIKTTTMLDTFTGKISTDTVSVGLTDAQTIVVLTKKSDGTFTSLYDLMKHNVTYTVYSSSKDMSVLYDTFKSYGYTKEYFLNPSQDDDGNYYVVCVANQIAKSVETTIEESLTAFIKSDDILSYKHEVILTDKKRDILLFYVDVEDQEDLRFFTVNEDDGDYDTITWTNKFMIDPYREDTIGVQFGFNASIEGQYINKVYVCQVTTEATDVESFAEDDDILKLGEFEVFSSAVGNDERYRNLFYNFGIPDPITYLNVFKDSSVAEGSPNYKKYDDKVDYMDLNKKSKTLFLSYSEIFPYVGTYKALVNAVDYLGYNDIYFKEWYKELSTSKYDKPVYTSYEIPYKSHGKNILKGLPIERRISLKKMNWLSMIYKINQELLDSDGEMVMEDYPEGTIGYMLGLNTPTIINNYENYSDREILIKLVALKRWLETYIIGLNCRIIDINGEGIFYENMVHEIHGKTSVGTDYSREMSLSPYVSNEHLELMLQYGDCNLHIGLREFDNIFINDAGESIIGTIVDKYGNLLPGVSEDDEEYVAYKKRVDTFKSTYNSFIVKATLSTDDAAFNEYCSSTGIGMTTQTILVHDGEIFFDPKLVEISQNRTESAFVNLPNIQIERANLKNINDPWTESTDYQITYSNIPEKPYKLVDVRNNKSYKKSDYVSLRPMVDESGKIIGELKYTTDNIHNVPLFIIKNFNDFQLKDNDDNYIIDSDEYILEILDGKFVFDEKITEDTYRTTYLNFNYDDDSDEQTIEVNYVYTKHVDVVDNGCGIDYLFNDDYTVNRFNLTDILVKNIGEYYIRVYGFDGFNNIYSAVVLDNPCVYGENPTFTLITDSSYSCNQDDFYNFNEDGSVAYELDPSFMTYEYPKLRESYLMNDVSVLDYYSDTSTLIKYATYPTLSYAVDTPKNGDIAHFMNLSDNYKVVCDASGNGILGTYPNIPEQYVMFLDKNYTFTAYKIHDKEGDNLSPYVNMVFYDSLHEEISFQCYGEVKLYDASALPDVSINSYDENGNIVGPQTIEEGQPYIILTQETFNSMYMYYENTIDVSTRYRYYESYDTQKSNTEYFYLTKHAFTAQKMFSILANSTIYKIYLQSRHEIQVNTLTDCTSEVMDKPYYSEDKKFIKVEIPEVYHPSDGSDIYKIGQLIRFRYVYDGAKTGSYTNKITVYWYALATYKIVDIIDGYLIIEHNISAILDELKHLYKKADGQVDDNSIVIKYGDETYVAPFAYDSNEDDWSTFKTMVISGSRADRVHYLYNINPTNEELSLYGVQMYIEHAHQAYVDYLFDVDHAKENSDGITELYVDDDEYLYFVDDTFSVLTKSFNVHNVYQDWINESELYANHLWYSYTIPVTLDQPDDYDDEFGTAEYHSIILTSDNTSYSTGRNHNYWRIYKYDKMTNTNKLWFEVWNDTVTITPKEPGIYSVEIFKYDEYGNLTSTMIQGAFKII